MTMLHIGLVGYGTGRRHFHTPFSQKAKGCQLAGVVAQADKTAAAVQADYPRLPVLLSPEAMIASGVVDAVTTCARDLDRAAKAKCAAIGVRLSAAEGIATMAVLDAARESVDQGRSISITEVSHG